MTSVGKVDGAKYDLGFADASGNLIGLILARDKNGKPRYGEWSDPGVAQQFFTGQVQYANFEPQKEVQIGQSTYEAGFGQEYDDEDDRYYTGTNIDARFKNMVICGPLATAATVPAAPTMTDAGLEAWDDANTLTNWTFDDSEDTDYTLTQEGTTIDEGTYSAKIAGETVTQTTAAYITQEVIGSGSISTYQGTTFSIAVRAYCSAAGNTAKLIIEDTATTTVTSTVTGAWETLVATHEVASNATELTVKLASYRQGATSTADAVYFDNVFFPTTDNHGSHWATFDNDLFFSSGRVLYRVSNSTGSITFQAGFPTAITGLTHFVDGKLYIFVEDDDKFLKDTGIDTDEALDISETEINTDADPSSAIPVGSIVQIESELMYVVDSDAGGHIDVVRAILGTEAATHTTNQDIFLRNNYYYYMDLSENVTRSDSVKDFTETIGSTMYSVLKPNMVFTATDPTTDTWSSETTVGSISDNITAIKGIAGTPYIMKEDFPYYLDSDGNPQELAPQLESEKATTSGVNTISWQGNLYIPCGAQALYEYDTSTSVLTDISPSKYITNSSDFDGQIQALAADSQYLIAILDNATKIEVLFGRWETIDSTTSFVWHTVSELTLTGCANAYASTVYKRRLWVGSTSSSDSLYYYPLTSMYGNITADTDYTYQTGGNIVTSWMHANLRADDKAFYKITLTMEDTTANIYWRAYYQKLGDSSWTEINSTSKFKTSPTTSASIPVDGSSNEPTSTMMRFKFEPVTNDTSTPPKLLNWDARAIWFPYIKKVITCTVKCADRLLLRNNSYDTQSASDIMTAIDAWANPSTAWPRAFYPPYWKSSSDTVYAKLLPTTGAKFLDIEKMEDSSYENEYVYNLTILIENDVSY